MKQVHPQNTTAYPTVVRLAPRRPRPPVVKPSLSILARIGLNRTKFRELSIGRIIKGGRISDWGRRGRYEIIIVAGILAAWGPAVTYVKYGKPSYTSHFALILPGAGASSSINLSEIGQASSASSSAFAGSTISPTVTYKNLLLSANVLDAAAEKLKMDPAALPIPTIKLVDETSFITVEMSGATAKEARNRADAVLDAFFAVVSKLREDETSNRDTATLKTIRQYEYKVNDVRAKISALQVQSGLNSADQFNSMITAADALETRIASVEADLARTQNAKNGLSANLNISDRMAATTMKLHADPEFAALIEATSKAEADHASIAEQYGANHPKVVEARAKLQGARATMLARASKITGLSSKKLAGKIDLSSAGQRSGLMSQLVTLSTEQQGLEGQLKVMKSDLATSRAKIATLVKVAADLDRLTSEHKVAEAVFASALARVSTSKTDIFASYPMVQVSEAAIMPQKPSSPNKKIAFGAAAGSTFLLFFSLLLAWVRRPVIDKLLKMAHKVDDQTKPA
jgi:uncharacterized protein involved in exopolysaccharide biosynthesis